MKIKFLSSLFFVTCLVGCGGNSVPVVYHNGTYQNGVTVLNGSSVYRGEVPDPTIVRGDDGLFYVFATGGIMLKSEDACVFEVVTRKVIDIPSWGDKIYPTHAGTFTMWAPDVIKIKDKWIYYYSLSTWGASAGIGYAIADEAAGPYIDKGKLFSGIEIEIQNCIDSHVFVEDDGRVYMTMGSFQGLYTIELTEDGMGLKNGLAYQRDNKVLIAGKPSKWDESTYEGSYIIKRNGYYYYFGSVGFCCNNADSTYHVVVGRSKSITGPYVDAKGIPMTMAGNGNTVGELVLWAGASNDKPYAGVGHHSILMDDKGDDWIYYHAYDESDNFNLRRLYMDRLEWTRDGWPYVSYFDDGVESKFKPSYGIELEGPSIL